MTKDQRCSIAARVITSHIRVRNKFICHCGKEWNPLHVAQALDAAGLLCSLKEEIYDVSPGAFMTVTEG
jgi:hypothetical protein